MHLAIQQPPKFPFWGKVLTLLSIAVCLIYLLSSCSCEALQKRLNRKCGYVQKDTLIVHDTVITETVRKDTIFKYNVRDTVIVQQKNMTYKYFFRQHDSTVYIDGKCKGDTIYIEKKVPYEKTEVKIDYFPNWLMWVILLIIIGALVVRLLK